MEQILEDLEKRYPDEKFVNHGHKTAMFTVLVGTTMPAILMESSFISNPEEEAGSEPRTTSKALRILYTHLSLSTFQKQMT